MPQSISPVTRALGTHGEPIRLDLREHIREAGIQMARQARRELLLFTRALDPDLYDHQPFLEGVQRLALDRSDLPVRILVMNPRRVSQRGHRLVELAQRLPSRIALRLVGEDDQDRLDAFLVADALGYVLRRQADTSEAVADFNGPLEARRLREEFEQMWAQGEADRELGRLHL